jgi:hypothetical protein
LTVVNFLDFWENGYGVLSEKWSLSSVAIFDFQIILVIIALTIIITFLDRSLRNFKSKAMQDADDERIQMALAISTYLFDQQRVTNVTVNQSLARAIREILNSTESLDKTSKELNKTVKLMPNNRDLLSEIKNIRTKLSNREVNKCAVDAKALSQKMPPCWQAGCMQTYCLGSWSSSWPQSHLFPLRTSSVNLL